MATTGTSLDTPESNAETHTARRGETLFAWTIFPLVMFGSLALAIYLLNSSNSALSPIIAYGVPGALAFALVILGERIYPYVPDWNRNHGDVKTDSAWLLSTFANSPLTGPITGLIAIPLAGWLSTQVGSPLWPAHWHLAGQLALALVVVEFFQYWVHRLQHETDILWRFHATHHSAPRLYWLNAARFHIVDNAMNGIAFGIPLLVLGADDRVFALWILAAAIHGICQHANMQIRCGPLNWIFSMAELHRWHHSRLQRESNSNYGQTLILWDIVFGTRLLPKDRQPPADIGIANLDAFPMTWWAQLVAPFRWARIKAESSG